MVSSKFTLDSIMNLNSHLDKPWINTLKIHRLGWKCGKSLKHVVDKILYSIGGSTCQTATTKKRVVFPYCFHYIGHFPICCMVTIVSTRHKPRYGQFLFFRDNNWIIVRWRILRTFERGNPAALENVSCTPPLNLIRLLCKG